eukprot:7441104-Pyramimonas_sp.AAC.1
MAARQNQRPISSPNSSSAWCSPANCLSTACTWVPILIGRSECSMPRLWASVRSPSGIACLEQWAGTSLTSTVPGSSHARILPH